METIQSVLAVDDDETFCRNLARLLQARGHRADVAFSGREALAKLERLAGQFDIVVLDVRMPQMNGLEVLRRVKARFPHIEVIVLTAFADVDCAVDAIRAGAFDFIVKPCAIEELTERVMAARDLEKIRRRPVLWPRTCARELILNFFIDLYPEDPLARAVEIITRDRSRRVAGTLFVVDRQGRLVGCVTRQALLEVARDVSRRTDLTWDDLSGHPEALMAPLTVGEVMRPDVQAVEPDTPLEKLAAIMLRMRFRSMPVVEQGRVIGIVRLRDVLRYLDRETYDASE